MVLQIFDSCTFTSEYVINPVTYETLLYVGNTCLKERYPDTLSALLIMNRAKQTARIPFLANGCEMPGRVFCPVPIMWQFKVTLA